MLIDVFTERGFTAVVDIRKMEVPSRIDPKSYEIINRVKNVYRVRINFPGSKIRRGNLNFTGFSLFMDSRSYPCQKFSLALGSSCKREKNSHSCF